eukprot:4571464-Alexandrium_andersonii.AAC.1
MGVSDVCGFRAPERAVWPTGRSGTAPPSGRILGPELNFTRGVNDRKGAGTYECCSKHMEEGMLPVVHP